MQYQAAKTHILERLGRELPKELTYHSLAHTKDVLRVVTELCELEGIDNYDTRLLQTAACYHDSGFLISHIDHEEIGCKIATATLPRYGYTPAQIARICGMIRATRIPQSPQNKLEEILCDADLDYLGREDFYTIGRTLFQEFCHFNVVDDEESWNRLQMAFLRMHSYFTSTNRRRREPQKRTYLSAISSLVEGA